MATLVSPGVKVTIIDDSLTPGQGDGTVPLIFIATASNKMRPDGEGVAEGTMPQNAEDLYLITSQRELLQTFGDPKFQSMGSTQIHGSPLSEYGLLAAHSYLGIANRAYVLRADLDLDQLQPTTIEPTNPVSEGSYWYDTDDSSYGLHELVVDPDDTNEVMWSPVSIDYVFTGTAQSGVGTDGEYGLLIDTISGVESTQFIKKDSGQWVNLHDLASTELVASRVYPSTSSLTNGAAGTAMWLKTSDGRNGTEIEFRQMNEYGQFDQVQAPVLSQDSDADSYHESPAYGDFYVQYSFDTGSESHLSFRMFDGNTWDDFNDYYSSDTVPTRGPSEGDYWYNADVGVDANGESTVDLLINSGTGEWVNIGLPGIDDSDMNGTVDGKRLYAQSLDPMSVPSITLSSGDLWLDTADLDNYPSLQRFKGGRWVAVDLTDQSTPNGILFADARVNPLHTVDGSAGGNGLNNGGSNGPNLDHDAPDADAYPAGMLLWNTRYSTRNVKQWNSSTLTYVDGNNVSQFDGRWVSVSGNRDNGVAYFGEDAQKQIVTQRLSSAIQSNDEIRAETTRYNLLAAPGYPELIDAMTGLNIDVKETAFVVGDCPFSLKPTGTELNRWSANLNNARGNGDEGLVTSNPYLGVYYPCGLGTNINGSEVVVPPSHMMLRTIAYNDSVAYPWFAPAGLRRGIISNANSVGYVNDRGEFTTVVLSEGLRDVLYQNNVNSITPVPNSGIVAYGQKTRNAVASAMDRVNVARLVNYVRRRCDDMARPFLFEQNDKQTRDSVLAVYNSFFSELVTSRALEDFLVVVDSSNNTPDRRDRNELWIDIAIIPLKSIEFVYIPIRIQNSGTL